MANYANEANASGLKPLVRRWRDLLREPVASICLLFLVFQLFCVGAALLFPDAFRYVTSSNVTLLQRAIPGIGIVALGIGLLMITGEYDLSVGSVYTLAGYSMALLYAAGASAVVALLVTLVIGIMIGTINGLITVKTGIPSFIATVGSMLLVRGLVRWLSESGSVSFRPGGAFPHIFTGSIFGVGAAFIWFVLLACVAALLLHRSKLGNHMFLVGGSERTARAVGINTHRVKVIAFALSGLAAAMAGVLSLTRVGTATPAQGIGMELMRDRRPLSLRWARHRARHLHWRLHPVHGGRCTASAAGAGLLLDVFVGAILVIAVIANTALAQRSA